MQVTEKELKKLKDEAFCEGWNASIKFHAALMRWLK